MIRRISLARVGMLLIALFAIPALACDFSFSTATITNAVMAKDVKGSNFDPVGITVYPSDQVKFHAVVTISNAPSDTKVKAAWTAVNVGGATAPNTLIDETEIQVEGSRNVDFTLTPNSGRWPPGAYKVDIYLNGKLERTLNFTLEGAPQARATNTLQAVLPTATVVQARGSPTTAPVSSPLASSGIITNAVLARDTTPLTSAPLGVTDTFPPDKNIHVNVAISNAPSGTALKVVWTAVDVGGAAPRNSEITTSQSTVEGTRYSDFVFYGTSRLPVGTYKMDIYLNGKLDRTLNMTVKENVPAFVAPTPKAIGGCPPPPKSEYKFPIIARKLTMAEGVKSDTIEPINATRQFKPTSVFHAIVELDNAPANSKIKAVWHALDTGGLESCNTRLSELELSASGNQKVWFNYRPPEKWPVGIYKVEIFVNGNLNNDVDFRVF